MARKDSKHAAAKGAKTKTPATPPRATAAEIEPAQEVDTRVARRRALDIPLSAIEKSRQRTARTRAAATNPFVLPVFPTAVVNHVPQARRLAMDEGIQSLTAWAGTAWSSISANVAFEGIAFLGYQYLAALSQRPEYRMIVETIATEMTRKWIRFQAKGDKDKTKKIEQIAKEFERLKVREHFGKACAIDGYFGRAHLYIDTGATDDREELKTPIGNGVNRVSDAKIGKGDLKRLKVIEPMWTYPTSYNSDDPLKPDWYNPQTWFVMAKEVHVSRLLPFVGNEVPDALKPAYSFGGLSMTQMAKPYVENFLNVRQSVADIIQAFSVFVLGTNLGESLSPGGEKLFNRADLFNNLRDNRGLMIIDKEDEAFQNVATPLSSLDLLQAQAQEHMASVSGIPLVKLLGISPHGLNATAEPELRAFYDTILAKQQKFFAPNLDRIFHLAQINIWGRVDPDLTYAFEPLYSLDEKGAAEMRKIEAETDAVLIDAGVISQAEARQRIAGDPDTPYQGLDVDDVPDLGEEEAEGLEPPGGRPDPAAVEREESGPFEGEA